MGRASAGDWIFVDLFRALVAVARETYVSAGFDDRSYSAGFACRLVFAQGSFVQTDADVRSGEANKRRRQLVEPDSARLPLLVATAANSVRPVG